MISDCVYEVWNWKYNQFTPCQIVSKVDSRFARIKYYTWKEDKETGEKKETGEYLGFTYISALRNIGENDFDILKLFPENTMLSVGGFDMILDKAEFNEEGDIRLFYKYIQCDESERLEIEKKNPAWSWINSYGVQYKKINSGYNFITITPETQIEFRRFIPSRIEEYRKIWYFEDPLDIKVQEDLEKLLGYTRTDGMTWMEYYRNATDGKKIGTKLRGETMTCIDSSDPKNPIQVLTEENIEVYIEKVSEYVKNKVE